MLRACEADLDSDPRSGQHVDQRVDTEELDFSLHQITDTRLAYAKQLGGVGLPEATSLNHFLQVNH